MIFRRDDNRITHSGVHKKFLNIFSVFGHLIRESGVGIPWAPPLWNTGTDRLHFTIGKSLEGFTPFDTWVLNNLVVMM